MIKSFLPSEHLLHQLVVLKRHKNLGGRPLMVSDLEDDIYQMRRYREADYGWSPTVDCFASAPVRALLASSLRDYYAEKYGDAPAFEIKPHNGPLSHDFYSLPSSGSCFAVFTIFNGPLRFDPILWFIDIANTTDQWDILEPNRHLAISGFSGVGFKD